MQQNTVDTNWINNIFAPLHDPQLLNRIFSYSTKEPWFFTEFSFLAVFGIFLVFYAAVIQRNAWRKAYIIAFSLFFYYKSSGPFLGSRPQLRGAFWRGPLDGSSLQFFATAATASRRASSSSAPPCQRPVGAAISKTRAGSTFVRLA